MSGALASPLAVSPNELDAGELAPGSGVVVPFVLDNGGSESLSFEFPGHVSGVEPGPAEISLEAENFGGFQFRPALNGPLAGSLSGFSGSLDLLLSAGATWTNDLAVLLTTTPELDFSAVVYQLGGNAAHLAPGNQIYHWSGGVGNSTITESFVFPQPIDVTGLYAWVGNAWSAGSGIWDGEVILDGLGGAIGLISALDPASGELGSGESLVIEALFEAGSRAPGIYEETLLLTSDHPDAAELNIPIRMTVLAQAALGPLPAGLDFGEVAVGASTSQTLSLVNLGNISLQLEDIAVDGDDYSVSASSLSIAPGSSAVLVISFSPQAVGDREASLSFSSNEEGTGSVSIPLSGTGLAAPAIALDPATLAVSVEADAQTSTSFDIVNNGEGTLEFTLFQAGLDSPAASEPAQNQPSGGLPAVVPDPVSGIVAPGEAVTITLQISAEGLNEGSFFALLPVSSNDPVNPVLVAELFIDVDGTALVDLPQTALDFGDAFIGQQLTQSLLINNAGTAMLSLTGFATDQDEFSVGSDSLLISPGNSALLPVTFAPSMIGPVDATLSFSSNDPSSPSLTVALSANVLESPSLALAPASIEAALAAGSSAVVNLDLSNVGTGALAFEFPEFASAAPTDAQLRGSASSQPQGLIRTPIDAQLAHAARESGLQAGSSPALMATQSASFEILLDAFQAFGGEFVPVGSGLSGELVRIDADFVLDQGSGFTWADDLTVLITDGPELTAEAILLQAGGTFTLVHTGPRLYWGMGSSSAPGTVVQTSLTLASPLTLDNATVWVGNAWVEQDSGQWSGLIGLDGVVDRTAFIVDVQPGSGVIGPGQSTTVAVSLSAADLVAGSYRDRLSLVSNDPAQPALNIPADLAVSGQAELVISPPVLDFGEVFVGATATATLLLENPGTDLLLIDPIAVSGSGFSSAADAIAIAPGSSALLMIDFGAVAAGSFNGEVLLSSNAPETSTSVALSAQARNPGLLSVSESSISIEVPSGAITQRTLDLSNIGEAALAYEILSWQGSEPDAAMLEAVPAVRGQLATPDTAIAALVPGRSSVATPGLMNERELLWHQPPDGPFRITSSRSTVLNAGVYAADDFQVEGAALVQMITAYGFRFTNDERFEDSFDSIVFYLYEDAGGRPAGHPDDGENAHLFRFEGNVGSPGFSVEEEPFGSGVFTDVSLDLEAATGAGLLLPDGRYWLLVHGVNASLDLYIDIWSLDSSLTGDQTAQFIDPDDVFSIDAGDWRDLKELINPVFANLAFRLEGRALNFLTASPAQGMIDVGQTETISLLFDASDYQPGSYELNLVIRTDSPQTPEVVVPVTMVVTEADDGGLDWVNLAGPAQAEIAQGQFFQITGNARLGTGRGHSLHDVQMWVGFSEHDTHPALWPASAWVPGTLTELAADHASFLAEAGAHLSPGQYRYATRFKLTGGVYVYGGYHEAGGGFWNGLLHISGMLNVLSAEQDRFFQDRFEN